MSAFSLFWALIGAAAFAPAIWIVELCVFAGVVQAVSEHMGRRR